MLNQTKEDQIADILREGIISGRFPRGARLKQAELAEMLGTSITPVREAIKLLEAEGFVVGASHRGAVVAPFDIDQTEEIVDLRVTLESKLALAALKHISQETLDELRKLQDEIGAAVNQNDRSAVRVLNYRFHQVMYAAANLPQTQSFVNILWARYPFDLINQVGGRIERASSEHQELLRAFITRDESAMLAALRAHIRAGWDEFKSNYKDA